MNPDDTGKPDSEVKIIGDSPSYVDYLSTELIDDDIKNIFKTGDYMFNDPLTAQLIKSVGSLVEYIEILERRVIELSNLIESMLKSEGPGG